MYRKYTLKQLIDGKKQIKNEEFFLVVLPKGTRIWVLRKNGDKKFHVEGYCDDYKTMNSLFEII